MPYRLNKKNNHLEYSKEQNWSNPQKIYIKQCFPLSSGNNYLLINNEKGEQINFIENLNELSKQEVADITNYLKIIKYRIYIEKIFSIKESNDLRHWHIECENNKRIFQTHLYNWPNQNPNGSIIIIDLYNDFYIIKDANKLDAKSKKLLWAYCDII